jgi:hypothetical protein
MTAQAPDLLIFEGREVALLSNPLEALWDKTHPRPRFIPTSTGLLRGYVATWAVENGTLLLLKVEGLVCVDAHGEPVFGCQDFMQESIGLNRYSTTSRPVSLQLLFPGAIGPILAKWFSGELRIPEGECVRYVHMGYGSVYARELLLQIDRGIVVVSRHIETGEGFRRGVEARKSRLDQRRPANSDPEGWVTCPHCGTRFTLRDKDRWDGDRHRSCGGRISLV